MAGRGPLDRLVRAPPPHRGRGAAWDHLSAGLHQDFLWQDWQAALAERGVEDCRWTPCYDCGVCTGYGIEHVVASPVPPAGGSQGTGQDLRVGGEVPVTLLASAARAGGGVVGGEGPRAVRQARQGPLDQPPRRGAHVGAGPAAGRGARRLLGGLLAPAQAVASGWPCPPGTSRSASTSTSSSAPGPSRTSTAWPDAPDVRSCRSARRARRASRLDARRAVAAAGRHRLHAGSSTLDGVDAGDGRRRASPPPWRPPTLVDHPHPQGPRGHRRRAARHPRAPRPARRRPATVPPSSPTWPPSPGGCGPPSSSTAVLPRCRGGPGAAHPPMDRARRRAPGAAPGSTCARRHPHAPAERAHEKEGLR